MVTARPTTIVKIAALLGASLIVLGVVRADAQTPSETVTERPHISTAMNVAAIFTQPLHPVLKGVGSGGGFGGGLGYDLPVYRGWETTAEGVATVKRFWSVEVTSRHETPRVMVEPYVRVRDMPRVALFGSGPTDRTHFATRDSVAGAHAVWRLTPWLSAGGRIEQLWMDVDAAGLAARSRFGRLHVFTDLISAAGPVGAPYQGGKTRIGYGVYDDQQLDRFSFRRLDVETQQRFSLFGPHRILTLHAWVSAADTSAGNDVPFFLQNTLGGKGHIRSVHEHILGSDGTDATLRGFPTFRFRGRHLLLLQAEYRWPIWGPIDATVFVDAGKVTSRRRDLNLSGLERNVGFSLGAVRNGESVLRMDVGFGGGEGVHVFFTVGRLFL